MLRPAALLAPQLGEAEQVPTNEQDFLEGDEATALFPVQRNPGTAPQTYQEMPRCSARHTRGATFE